MTHYLLFLIDADSSNIQNYPLIHRVFPQLRRGAINDGLEVCCVRIL